MPDISVRMEWLCSGMPMNTIDSFKVFYSIYLRIPQPLWAYTFEIDTDKLVQRTDFSLDLMRKTFADIHPQLNSHSTRHISKKYFIEQQVRLSLTSRALSASNT